MMLSITLIAQIKGDYLFKNEIDKVNILFIDEKTAEMVKSEVLD